MKTKSIPSYDIYKKLESDLQFECWTLEETHNPYDSTQPHRHNYYEIFFFEKTGGSQEIDFQVYPVKRNTLHFISPLQVHLLKRKLSVNGYVISFTKEFFTLNTMNEAVLEDFLLFNYPVSPPVIELKKNEQQKNVLELIRKIKSEFSDDKKDKATVLRSYLHIFLVEMRRMFEPVNAFNSELTVQQDFLRKFKRLIDKNFTQLKFVSDYADLLHISPGHLNDTVHLVTGKTASDLIHERIILESKRLLYYSGQNVKEIAYLLNFDDPSYFAKFFKNHVGISPEAFRLQIREKYH